MAAKRFSSYSDKEIILEYWKQWSGAADALKIDLSSNDRAYRLEEHIRERFPDRFENVGYGEDILSKMENYGIEIEKKFEEEIPGNRCIDNHRRAIKATPFVKEWIDRNW